MRKSFQFLRGIVCRSNKRGANSHGLTGKTATHWQPLLRLLLWPLMATSALAALPYVPAPFTTNDWPWNINLVNDVCTNPPADYVIAGGDFDTSALTAPPSVGGGTVRSRIEMTPTGPVAVFSFPSLVITGAVRAVGTNPMVLEACQSIKLYD